MAGPFKVALHKKNPAWMPEKAHDDDSGFDLKARVVCPLLNGNVGEEMILENGPYYLAPRHRILVKTGVFIALEKGWEAQIRPRSGMALKYGITITNAPGTIDAGYRNEIGVILHNLGDGQYAIGYKHKIAQMVIQTLPAVSIQQVDFLDDTERGKNGFGSTGA